MSFTLFKPSYTDKATGTTRESGCYHIRFRDHLKRRQTIAAFPDARRSNARGEKLMQLIQCRQSGAQLSDDLSKWKDGLPQPVRERIEKLDLIDATSLSAEWPLIDHLEGHKDADGSVKNPGFQQAILAKGNTADHADKTAQRLRAVFEGAGLTFYRDMIAPGANSKVEVWLGDRRARGEIGAKTFNFHVRDLKSFCRWLVREKRVPGLAMADLAKMHKTKVQMDEKKRRAISIDEMRELVDTTASSGQRHGLTGDERALLYRFAFETGIRPGQIRKMTVGDFDLNAEPPKVTTHARHVKARRTHIQEIRPALASDLAARFAHKVPTAEAFKMPSEFNLARMIRADLADARRKWIDAAQGDRMKIDRAKSDFLTDVNHEGETAVFYSTRHGHGTALANAGVPEKDIAASMHHQSPLTTKRYLHTDRSDVHKAIERMPDMSYKLPLAATGTDCASATDLRKSCASGASSVGFGSVLDGLKENDESAEKAEKQGFSEDFSKSGSVAQRLEQGTHNSLVLGSNPSVPSLIENIVQRLRSH